MKKFIEKNAKAIQLMLAACMTLVLALSAAIIGVEISRGVRAEGEEPDPEFRQITIMLSNSAYSFVENGVVITAADAGCVTTTTLCTINGLYDENEEKINPMTYEYVIKGDTTNRAIAVSNYGNGLGGANVRLNNVTITVAVPLNITGAVVNLHLVGINTLKATGGQCPAVNVPNGATLRIYGDGVSDQLRATGGPSATAGAMMGDNHAAAIGTGNAAAGSIQIYGGNVSATGTGGGIGCGGRMPNSGNPWVAAGGGYVTIYGGFVYADGQPRWGIALSLTVYGGTVICKGATIPYSPKIYGGNVHFTNKALFAFDATSNPPTGANQPTSFQNVYQCRVVLNGSATEGNVASTMNWDRVVSGKISNVLLGLEPVDFELNPDPAALASGDVVYGMKDVLVEPFFNGTVTMQQLFIWLPTGIWDVELWLENGEYYAGTWNVNSSNTGTATWTEMAKPTNVELDVFMGTAGFDLGYDSTAVLQGGGNKIPVNGTGEIIVNAGDGFSVTEIWLGAKCEGGLCEHDVCGRQIDIKASEGQAAWAYLTPYGETPPRARVRAWYSERGQMVTVQVKDLTGDLTEEYALQVYTEEGLSGYECLVTFNYGLYSTVEIVEGDTAVAKPTNPEREGFIFLGWYSDEECTTGYSFSSAVTSNITIYAGWYEIAGGTGGGGISPEDLEDLLDQIREMLEGVVPPDLSARIDELLLLLDALNGSVSNTTNNTTNNTSGDDTNWLLIVLVAAGALVITNVLTITIFAVNRKKHA